MMRLRVEKMQLLEMCVILIWRPSAIISYVVSHRSAEAPFCLAQENSFWNPQTSS